MEKIKSLSLILEFDNSPITVLTVVMQRFPCVGYVKVLGLMANRLHFCTTCILVMHISLSNQALSLMCFFKIHCNISLFISPELESSKKQAEADKKAIDDLVRERDILNKVQLVDENITCLLHGPA